LLSEGLEGFANSEEFCLSAEFIDPTKEIIAFSPNEFVTKFFGEHEENRWREEEDPCVRMLTSAEVCRRMLTYADVC
jgi:hypothetical protein